MSNSNYVGIVPVNLLHCLCIAFFSIVSINRWTCQCLSGQEFCLGPAFPGSRVWHPSNFGAFVISHGRDLKSSVRAKVNFDYETIWR
jgi:hypothetical protein